MFFCPLGKHKIDNERQALNDKLHTLVQHLTTTTQQPQQPEDKKMIFLSGLSEPHLGDLAVYGALKGIAGTDIHEECFQSQDPILQTWYNAVEQKVYPAES